VIFGDRKTKKSQKYPFLFFIQWLSFHRIVLAIKKRLQCYIYQMH